MTAGPLLRSYLWRIGLILALLLTDGSGAQATPKLRSPLKQGLHRRTPRVTQVGKASWYGDKYQGKTTASGERFDPDKLTAAHRTLPLGTTAKVTNLETGQAVRVTINDRGPRAKGRIIDLSRGAAQRIGLKKDGTTRVSVEASPPAQASQTAWAARRQSKKARKKLA